MSYNHGAAQRAFEREWQKKEKQYRGLGMTDEQISSIREFDEREFRADRAYLEKKSSSCRSRRIPTDDN